MPDPNTALYNDFEEWFIQIMLRYRVVKSKLCLKKLVLVSDGCFTTGTVILVMNARYLYVSKVVILYNEKSKWTRNLVQDDKRNPKLRDGHLHYTI